MKERGSSDYEVGTVLVGVLEAELVEQEGRVGGREGRVQRVQQAEILVDRGDGDLADLHLRHRERERRQRLQREVPDVLLLHRQTVVDAQQDLVVPRSGGTRRRGR